MFFPGWRAASTVVPEPAKQSQENAARSASGIDTPKRHIDGKVAKCACRYGRGDCPYATGILGDRLSIRRHSSDDHPAALCRALVDGMAKLSSGTPEEHHVAACLVGRPVLRSRTCAPPDLGDGMLPSLRMIRMTATMSTPGAVPTSAHISAT